MCPLYNTLYIYELTTKQGMVFNIGYLIKVHLIHTNNAIHV